MKRADAIAFCRDYGVPVPDQLAPPAVLYCSDRFGRDDEFGVVAADLLTVGTKLGGLWSAVVIDFAAFGRSVSLDAARRFRETIPGVRLVAIPGEDETNYEALADLFDVAVYPPADAAAVKLAIQGGAS